MLRTWLERQLLAITTTGRGPGSWSPSARRFLIFWTLTHHTTKNMGGARKFGIVFATKWTRMVLAHDIGGSKWPICPTMATPTILKWYMPVDSPPPVLGSSWRLTARAWLFIFLAFTIFKRWNSSLSCIEICLFVICYRELNKLITRT